MVLLGGGVLGVLLLAPLLSLPASFLGELGQPDGERPGEIEGRLDGTVYPLLLAPDGHHVTVKATGEAMDVVGVDVHVGRVGVLVRDTEGFPAAIRLDDAIEGNLVAQHIKNTWCVVASVGVHCNRTFLDLGTFLDHWSRGPFACPGPEYIPRGAP